MLTPLPEIVAEARQNLRCLDAATALAEAGENRGTVIDVREQSEAAAAPAPRSINIPRGVLEMKLPELVGEADHPIYLHCATGGRASLAAEQLKRLGYENITVITCPAEEVISRQA
jgi:rhodanese-related sulfurtransferase